MSNSQVDLPPTQNVEETKAEAESETSVDFDTWFESATQWATPAEHAALKDECRPLSQDDRERLVDDAKCISGAKKEVRRLDALPEPKQTREVLASLAVLGTFQAHPEEIMEDGPDAEGDVPEAFKQIIMRAQAAESFSVINGFPLHMLNDGFKSVNPLVLEYFKAHKIESDANFPFILAAAGVTDELVQKFKDAQLPENQTDLPSNVVELAFLVDNLDDNVVSLGIPLTERAQTYKKLVEQVHTVASKVDQAMFQAKLDRLVAGL